MQLHSNCMCQSFTFDHIIENLYSNNRARTGTGIVRTVQYRKSFSYFIFSLLLRYRTVRYGTVPVPVMTHKRNPTSICAVRTVHTYVVRYIIYIRHIEVKYMQVFSRNSTVPVPIKITLPVVSCKLPLQLV